MPVTIKTKVGAHMIEATAENIKEAIELQSILSECPQKCGLCSSQDIAFNHRTAQTYHFYALRCRSCGAEYAFGQKKGSFELFPKGPWARPERAKSHQEADPEDYRYEQEPPPDERETYDPAIHGEILHEEPPAPRPEPPRQQPLRHQYDHRTPAPSSHKAPAPQHSLYGR